MVDATLEVLGCTLLGPPPLRGCELRFDSSVTVLYGLNGAGKSSVIDAVRAAITGIRGQSDVQLHLRMCESAATILGLKGDGLFSAVRNCLQTHPIDLAGSLAKLARERLLEEWVDRGGETDAIAGEIASQGYFTLVPEGVRVAQWRVFISARTDSDTPALNREIVRFAEDMRRHADAYDPEDDEFGDFWYAMDEVLSSSPLGSAVDQSEDPFEVDPPFTAPTTLPTILVECGEITAPAAPLLPLLAHELEGVHELTKTVIAGDAHGRRFGALDPDTGEVESSIGETAAQLSALASDIYAMVMLDAPVLRCRIRPVDEWFWEDPLHWEARDVPTDVWVPVEQLSLAQRRWAAVAIHAAIATHRPADAPGFVVLDEPEAALHPTAQTHLAQGLCRLAEHTAARTLVATHSPALLDQPGINVIHVRRDPSGNTELVPIDAVTRDHMDELGLRPSDLLQMQRTILLVEGQHDCVILTELIGPELARDRAWIVPVRGGARLEAVVDSQMLFDYTQARLIAVLDNLDADEVRPVWREACAHAGDGDLAEAITALQQLDKRKAENKFVIEFGAKALAAGWHDRVTIFGFQEADILYYLPVNHFVRKASTWAELLEQYSQESTKLNFKAWLAKSRGVDISDDNIRAAVQRMDAIPPEFTELLRMVSARPGTTTPTQ